jgi:hypothetical protein
MESTEDGTTSLESLSTSLSPVTEANTSGVSTETTTFSTAMASRAHGSKSVVS